MACALKSRQKSLCPETPGRMKFLLLYGLLGFAMTTTLLQSSYLYLPVGTATTIHYLFPLLVNLGGLIFFRESLHKVTLVVLAGVLCGIIFLAGEKEGIQIFGIALAFASSITWAFHMLYLDHSVLRDEPTLRMVFWQSLLCSGAGAILSVLRRESLVAGLRPIVLGGILLSALCSNVFACGLLNVGIRRTGSGDCLNCQCI